MSNKPPIHVPQPELGWVSFMSYVPYHVFTCRLGDGSPTITGGGGMWDRTKRRRKQSLMEWNGNDPITIEIPLLFDDWIAGKSVEDDVKALENMWGIGEDGGEPPLLSFNSGGVIPHDNHDAPTHDWVIDDVDWGDADRNVYGNRVRQAATVTVAQFIEDTILSDQSAAQRHALQRRAQRQRKGAANKSHTIKPGQSLDQVAAMRLGSAARWGEIGKLNGIRDPKAVKAGQVVKLP